MESRFTIFYSILSFVFAGLVLLLQPYKKTSHNIIDFLTLFWMSVVGAMAAASYFPIILILVLLCYLIYRVIKCCRCCATQNMHNSSCDDVDIPYAPLQQQPLVPPTTTVVGVSDYDEDDEYPDRMVLPDGYNACIQ